MTIEDPSVREGVRCPQCGALESAPRRFCGECGAELYKDSAASAERRSLTVMFCDVAGSTALSERLDPEELGELIVAYREIAAAATTKYGGFVARYVGDGVLAYFGYPKAHGDDPARALYAALEVVSGMRKLNRELQATRNQEIRVRVGLHTGLVLVGDLGRGTAREEAGALGETPNLAARIMDLAPVGGVLASGVTQGLAATQFNWRDAGEQRIEGLSRPVRVFELLSVRRRAPDQFSHTPNVTALANRLQELSFLQRRWSSARAGRGQAVAITGEPGIGKSRVIRAFMDGLAGTEHASIALQCSPYFSNSAFHPIVDYLNRWLDKSDVEALEQLASAVRSAGMAPDEVVPILAALVSVPLSPPYRAPQIAPRVQRDLTMEFLGEWLVFLASRRPTLMVIEDLQWADASTLELVRRLLERLSGIPVMLVAAYRLPFRGPWDGDNVVEHLHVERLTAPHVHELIANVVQGKKLPQGLLERVAERTDGVPLFVEELTKAVLETHAAPQADAGAAKGEIDIPISLHATLMARLDSMNSAKRVAQRAAVLGREFSYDLLVQTAALDPEELDRGLAQLVSAELLFQFGTPPASTYLFKHSMIQETAYRSLLRSHRRDFHSRIADVLTTQFETLCETQPEIVAHHYSGAQRPLEAAAYWRRAGQSALSRSANVEAYAHLHKGLDELSRCAASQEKLQQEVQLLVAFGSALSALKGSAAPEVEQTYARAWELCRQLDDRRLLFPVLRGLHSFYVVHGPLRTACAMVEELHGMAEAEGDPILRVEALRRLGWCRFCMGDGAHGRESLEQAMGLYDRSQSMRHILTVGSDPGVIGFVNLAWLEGIAGHTTDAARYAARAVDLAREISYDLGLAYALGMSAALWQCIGDAARTADLARQTISLAASRGFPYWEAWETGLLGWATAAEGSVDVGITLLERGFAGYRETGSGLFCSHMLGMLADAHLRARRYDRALSLCEEALAFAERTDARFYDAEIHRLEGECLLARDADVEAAANSFAEAMSIARRQGSGMLELRAARRLAAVERSLGHAERARAALLDAIAGSGADASCDELQAARAELGPSPATRT